MKFKVGDIIRGKKDNGYMFTDECMTKGEVIEVDNDDMRIEILEHTYVNVIGKRCNVDNDDSKFELAYTELDKLQRKLEKHENKVKEIKEKIKQIKSKIEVGDTVKVINSPHSYKEFYSWVEREIDNVKTRYCYDIYNEPDNGFVCEVLHIAKHNDSSFHHLRNDTLAYVKHLDTGRCYLISVKGLEKC